MTTPTIARSSTDAMSMAVWLPTKTDRNGSVRFAMLLRMTAGCEGVVLITGISAAGKSTVAELLAQRFERGVHVKGDVFRRMVVSGREPMTADPSDEAV